MHGVDENEKEKGGETRARLLDGGWREERAEEKDIGCVPQRKECLLVGEKKERQRIQCLIVWGRDRRQRGL